MRDFKQLMVPEKAHRLNLKRYREHINDHQVGTASQFEQLGHILVAYDADELSAKIQLLETFVPKPRKNQADQVASRIREYLESL